MLVLAEIELIFFRIASRGLGFDFVLASIDNTVVFIIAEPCLHRVKTFSCFSSHRTSKIQGAQEAGKRQTEQLIPAEHKDTLSHNSTHRTGERRR